MSDLNNPPVVKRKFSVWLTQGFSSQRDLLMALNQSGLQPHLTTIASHRKPRDEILSVADIGLIEPSLHYQQMVLHQAIELNVQLVLVSHNCAQYEQLRPAFEQHGITLLTGSVGVAQHHLIEDKYQFSQLCRQHAIPVVEAIQVDTTEQLKQAIAALGANDQPVCVKPVIGVFAQGFWQLKSDVDYFHSLLAPLSFQANTQQFIDAYDQQVSKTRYLVMPFLTGSECSVDMFCVRGQLIRQVTRIKHAAWQELLPLGPCDDLCHRLAQLLTLDGIVNAQFRQDSSGQWHVLEVNARPSGGIGMTLHSGINLMAECVAYHAGLPLTRDIAQPALVRQVNHSVTVDLAQFTTALQQASEMQHA